MFIQVYKYGKNKQNVYVKLVEGYRENGKVKNRVIKNFGRLDDMLAKDPLALDKLKEKYKQERETKRLNSSEQRAAELQTVLSSSCSDLNSTRPLLALRYGHLILKQIWDEDLGLTAKVNYLQKTYLKSQFDLNRVLSFYTCMKILDPSSYLLGFGDQDGFLGDPLRDVDLSDIYRALGYAKEFKDSIMQGINRRLDASLGKDRATMIFYDVTNAYFESELTDAEKEYEQKDFPERLKEMAEVRRKEGRLESGCFDESGCVIAEKLPGWFLEEICDERIQYLRMRGPSKEHRYDLPIVSIALVIDSYGIPMDFEVYAGNTSEFKTMKKSIDNLRKKYSISRTVVVADRGLNSVANLTMLKDLGMGFLVAQKVTQFNAALTKQMLNLDEYTAINDKDPDMGKYRVISDYLKTGAGGESVKCQLVFTYNEKRKKRDDAILNTWADIVKAKAESGQKLGPRKTAWAAIAKIPEDVEQPILGVDEEALEKKRRFSGFAAVIYADAPSEKKDDKTVPLTGAQISGAYHSLVRIEECFRIMKTNLGLRPMRVRNSDHIRGHVTLCVIALIMLRLLQRRLTQNGTPMSVETISHALLNAQVSVLKAGADAYFLHTSHNRSIRVGREQHNDEELLKLLEDPKCRSNPIADLMTACGLTPLPRVCNIRELGRCLRIRFGSLEEAMSPLSFKLL